MTVRLYPGALAALAGRPDVQAAVKEAAEKVADRVRGQSIGVGGEDFSPTERPLPVTVRGGEDAFFVVLEHPAGLAVQAKHGVLTKAAAAEGLEVGKYYTTKAGKTRLATQAQIDNWTRGSR